MLLLWLFFYTEPVHTLHFAYDLKKDSIIYSEQHGVYVGRALKYDWATFSKYAHLNLAGFKFERQRYFRFAVNKWVGPPNNNIIIREIDTLLEINAAEVLKDINGTSKIDAPPQSSKPARLKFHIYIIDQPKSFQLVYLTEEYQGVCEYRIGNQIVESIFEDVPVGFRVPQLNGILKKTNLRKKR